MKKIIIYILLTVGCFVFYQANVMTIKGPVFISVIAVLAALVFWGFAIYNVYLLVTNRRNKEI